MSGKEHHYAGLTDDDPAGENCEFNNPILRFSQLPEPTRKFLEELRADDLTDLVEAIKFQRSAKTVARFIRWLILTVVVCFVGAAQFGEAVQKLWHLMFPGGPR